MKEWILRRRWRIILAGILIMAVPLIGLALFVHFEITAALEDRIVKETGWFSKITVHTIKERLRSDIAYGRAYAARPYLLAGLKRGDKKEMDMHLKDLVNNTHTIERAFIASPRGVLLADYPVDLKVHGRDFSDRDWYKGVSKTWEPYVSEFYMRMAEPMRYSFAIAIPMKSKGEIVGILVMHPKADYIKDALGGIEIGKGHVQVVDKKGNLIYHSEYAIDRIIDFTNSPVVQKVLKGMEGVEEITDPEYKKPFFSAYHPLKEWGWGVIVDKPKDVVLAPARKISMAIFSITGIILLIGSYFAYKWSDVLGSVQKLKENLSISNAELKAMNEELRSQQKELQEANARLIEVSRAKSDFLANMSHELRTPLNSILGFSEVLQDQLYGELNEKQLEYIEDIHISGMHLLQLINDILDLAKVESGKMELSLNRFSLKDCLNASMTMLKEKAMKHGIGLSLNIEPEADIEIEADERKIKQIMFNLLSNAVKFTPDGGSVQVYARKVRSSEFGVGSSEEQKIYSELMTQFSKLDNLDYIEISVVDTGIGIKPGDIPKLFTEFSQLENVYTKTKEGTGLGLALTKRLIELHEGKIWVESEFGKGSKFTFIIPVSQAKNVEIPVPVETVMPRDKATGRCALVIEDDPIAISLVEGALTADGYKVFKASNGIEGIELAKKEIPDLIVLDLMLPGMSGFEVAEILNSDERTAGIPIVVLTSMNLSTEDRKRLGMMVKHIADKGDLTRERFMEEVRKHLKNEY